MEKQDIINYVMHTPGNTNPAVLGSMVDSVSGGSGGGGSMMVTFTMGDVLTADKSIAEIYEASTTQDVIGVWDGVILQLSVADDGEVHFHGSLSESPNDVSFIDIHGIEEEGIDSWEKRDAISTLVPSILNGSANDVLKINSAGDGVEWAAPSGGSGSSNTYRILADWNYEHTITVPPTDAVALPTGERWEVDTNYQFDHYLVDAEGNALTADDIEAIKVDDVILEQPVNEYYNDSYLKSTIAGIMNYNGFDSAGNAKCVRVIYYNNIMGSGKVAVGYGFVYEAPIEHDIT